MRIVPAICCVLLPAASAPAQADSGRLERARAIAMSYSRTLPDFVCTQVVQRYVSWERQWNLRDLLVVKLDFVGGRETYPLVAIDGHEIQLHHEQISQVPLA